MVAAFGLALLLLFISFITNDKEECSNCNGTGTLYSHTTPYECPHCRGTGYKNQ